MLASSGFVERVAPFSPSAAGGPAAVDRWTMRDLLREHGVDLRVGFADAEEAADDTAAATELEFSTAAADDASQSE